MKKLTKDTTRQEIEQAIKSQINTNPLSRLSPEEEYFSFLPLFVDIQKVEYKFQDKIDEDITYLGKIEDRVEKVDNDRHEQQLIALQHLEDERIIGKFIDRIEEVLESQKIELPIEGMNEKSEDVKIGTKTLHIKPKVLIKEEVEE